MKLLLDTHALIWWVMGDDRLRPATRDLIHAGEVFVSAISAMEICTKHRLGRLPEAASLASAFEAEIAAEQFVELPLTARHAQRAGSLLIAHKDPFDRMLIAQSLIEGLPLVSNEAVFDGFGVVRIW